MPGTLSTGWARLALPAPDAPARPSPTLILGVILATYLMIILDATVVITALPKIAERLDFSPAALSWVQSAYALTFGGLLLLGARMGDILGRRRTFVAGIALFTVASLVGGLAQTQAWLLIARAVQGVGAAIAAPSSLALLTTNFREGPERMRALAAYGAVASGGGSVGLVLGGMLTDWISWRWGLWINVPVGAALIWLAPRVLAETERRPGHFDLPGAAASSAGMTALVYGFVHAAQAGWGDTVTVVSFTLGAVLLASFVAVERRAAQPVTPLRLFASRQRAGAYLARMLLVGGMFSMFFFVSQYLQGVRGFSPLQAGLGFLPMTVVMFSTVRVVPRLSARWGDARLLVVGVVVALAGMACLSRLDTATPFFPDIVLPLVLLGLGMGAALAPLTAAALAGVAPADAGAASGVVNAAQQLGVSLGLSVLVTVAAGAGGASAGAETAPGLQLDGAARAELAHAVSAALTGSAVLLALGLAVIAASVGRFRRATTTPVLEAPDEHHHQHPHVQPDRGRRDRRVPARPEPSRAPPPSDGRRATIGGHRIAAAGLRYRRSASPNRSSPDARPCRPEQDDAVDRRDGAPIMKPSPIGALPAQSASIRAGGRDGRRIDQGQSAARARPARRSRPAYRRPQRLRDMAFATVRCDRAMTSRVDPGPIKRRVAHPRS